MNNFKFLVTFFTDEDITRLRVFLTWFLVSIAPALYIVATINHWLDADYTKDTSLLVPMFFGSLVLPITFTITKGLRGFHRTWARFIDFVLSRFERRSYEDLAEEFGPDEAKEKIRKVNVAINFSAFLVLELLIIGWDVALYPFFRSIFGLGLAAYISDDLLRGAIVLLLEGFYSTIDGIKEGTNIYKVNPLKIVSTDKTSAMEEIS